MLNTDASFYGQQQGEKILYVIRPHIVTLYIALFKLAIAVAVILLSMVIAASVLPALQRMILLAGSIGSIVVGGVGLWITLSGKSIAYVTDRRIIKFDPTTPFATNIRSLSWDEVVKVNTFSHNLFLKQMKIGTVLTHAKSTIASTDKIKSENITTDDDIEIKNVYYYRDLGNYIEKILYLYKKHPKEIMDLPTFVSKPRGMR
jgi:hypothetical protein